MGVEVHINLHVLVFGDGLTTVASSTAIVQHTLPLPTPAFSLHLSLHWFEVSLLNPSRFQLCSQHQKGPKKGKQVEYYRQTCTTILNLATE